MQAGEDEMIQPFIKRMKAYCIPGTVHGSRKPRVNNPIIGLKEAVISLGKKDGAESTRYMVGTAEDIP